MRRLSSACMVGEYMNYCRVSAIFGLLASDFPLCAACCARRPKQALIPCDI